jgi:hypothetical protein
VPNKATSLALVIDRPTAVRIGTRMQEFGAAWVVMFELWLRTDMRYLVMMANTKERVRAPLVAMAMDDDALRMALQEFCQQLSDTTCQWCLFVETGSAADRITRDEILLDSVTEGTA